MKHELRFLNFLFHPLGLLIIFLLLFSLTASAQEQTPPGEFPVGSPIMHKFTENEIVYNVFDTTGFNLIFQRADPSYNNEINQYDLIAYNNENVSEYIYHYSSAYYSKWEAELYQENEYKMGVKHADGDTATWKGVKCWSTIGLSSPVASLMYGPHYWQDKTYKRTYPDGWREDEIEYNVRFNMALRNLVNVPDTEEVCVIKVVFSYRNLDTDSLESDTFLERTLTVGDFDSTENFSLIDLDGQYFYDTMYIENEMNDKIINPPLTTGLNYRDTESKTGIQYVVDWLRDDGDCILYIDYVEVYDMDGWHEYIESPGLVTTRIQEYAASFNNQYWQNIKFWGGVDEPSTIDSYTPVRIVNSILEDADVPSLFTVFNPSWSWNHLINGEMQMVQYDSIAKPKKLALSVNPCDEEFSVLTFNQIDWLRHNLQLASQLDSSFWYNAQTHGYSIEGQDNTWCVWRKPEPPELSSMVMLALAHGTKGINYF